MAKERTGGRSTFLGGGKRRVERGGRSWGRSGHQEGEGHQETRSDPLWVGFLFQKEIGIPKEGEGGFRSCTGHLPDSR